MMKVLSMLLLVPLDDAVVFPNMNVTLTVDVGDEERVLLVPRHDGEYAKVGTVAEVAERVRLPGAGTAVNLVGLHRGIAGAARTDPEGRLRVEVQEHPDEEPPAIRTRELEQEYRAVVEEILELRGDDGRISAFVRSIREVEWTRKELGEDDASVWEDYRRKIAEAELPGEVREQAEREVSRLERMGD